MLKDPAGIYTKRIKHFSTQETALIKKEKRFSIARLICFVLLIALIILLFKVHWVIGIIAIYVSITIFYFLVKAHNKVSHRLAIVKSLVNINRLEKGVLNHRYNEFNDGNNFKDEKHPYVNDLDIFGKNGLFQYTNRCHSIFGEHELASMYANGIDEATIPKAQEAVKELEPLLDWRQEYQASCQSNKHETVLDIDFLNWIQEDADIDFKLWLCIALPLLTLIFFSILYIYFPTLSYWIAFIPAGRFAFNHASKITAFQSNASQHSKTLKKYAEAISWIEEYNFKSSLLQDRQRLISNTEKSTSKAIKKLAYILHQLDLRHNFFGIMVNLIFPWDYYWAYRLQQWKDKNKEKAPIWFQTIGWFEAISSLANLSYNNPDWVFPTITKKTGFDATALGHPLIHKSNRIANDFIGQTKEHIKIVTGSNMGGKSTFLRTIGTNIILANCGSKVCASQLSIPYLRLYTSMRTLDALDENTSSFYAELKRLKLVLDAVDQYDNVYFLLDEILKGTNSIDRHTGAKALIKGLLRQNGAGLISTHDLELGQLEKEYPETIENICFEVTVTGDELYFDYKLKKGISKSFNASHLMRNMGIDV